MSEIAGGSLTGFTTTVNVSLADNDPSLTVTVINAVPDWLATGDTSTVRLAPLRPIKIRSSGTSARLSEFTLKVSCSGAVSGSLIVNGIGPVLVSSLIVWLGMSEIDGPSLTGFTTTVNVSLADIDPSLTVTVINAVPRSDERRVG